MSNDKEESLIQRIVLGEWIEKVDAADALAPIASPEAIDVLTHLLTNRDGQIRNAAALALRGIGSNSAVLPLLNAIQFPENHNNRSTLVYALETLDCGRHFIEIFELALASKVDVQVAALNILDEQTFSYNLDDIAKASAMLEAADKEKVEYDRLNEYLLALHLTR
jgi:HEAT repeat protein